jgi:fatty acid-binding protein DegV
VCITLSKNISNSYQSAIAASEIAKEKGKNVEVLDSNSTSAGLGLIAYKAARLASEGANREDVISFLDRCIKETRLIVFAETFRYRFHSGRTPPLVKILTENKKEKSAFEEFNMEKKPGGLSFFARGDKTSFKKKTLPKSGEANPENLKRRMKDFEKITSTFNLMRIRAVVRIVGGQIKKRKTAIGPFRAVKKIINIITDDFQDIAGREYKKIPFSMTCSHSADTKKVDKLRESISKLNCTEFIDSPLGQIISMFAGPGAMIVAYWPEYRDI